MHVEQVCHTIGEQRQLKHMVESFMGQVARWWETHQSRMPTWIISSTYFIERFGGNKLTTEEKIPKSVQGMDPYIHIDRCQK